MASQSSTHAVAQAKMNRQFNNALLLTEALQVAGSVFNFVNGRTVTDGNKRLALLGDCVLKLALLDTWYPQGDTRGTFNNRMPLDRDELTSF